MSYYDRFAKQWHQLTGYRGGAFKKLVLNEFLLDRIAGLTCTRIPELGAGNGYFMPMLLERSAGNFSEWIVVTDISSKLLDIAQRHFAIKGAEYRQLDIRGEFPFSQSSFDLVLATMVFNEVSDSGLKKALGECHYVLSSTGGLLFTVTQTAFVESLIKREQTRPHRNGLLTIPGADQLRLPVFPRSKKMYEEMVTEARFVFETHDIHATREVIMNKPGLKCAGKIPLALVCLCRPNT